MVAASVPPNTSAPGTQTTVASYFNAWSSATGRISSLILALHRQPGCLAPETGMSADRLPVTAFQYFNATSTTCTRNS
eukprot:2649783-Rhodomonas_salina.2